MTCGPSCLPCHSMFFMYTLVIYLCTLDGLELHWVQGGPIVTLASLFLFLFTPCPIHDSWNWSKTWLKYKPKIKHILLYIVFIKLLKKWKSIQQLILPEMRVFWTPSTSNLLSQMFWNSMSFHHFLPLEKNILMFICYFPQNQIFTTINIKQTWNKFL